MEKLQKSIIELKDAVMAYIELNEEKFGHLKEDINSYKEYKKERSKDETK